MKIETDNYMTVEETAKKLRCSTKKAYQVVKQPGFPKIIIGKSILIPESEFDKFMHRNIGKKFEISSTQEQ